MDWHDLSNWCSRCGKPVTKASHIHTCVPHPVIEDLRAQLAEAQRELAKLREFVTAYDAWRGWLGNDRAYLAMLEKRAAVGG